MKFTNLGISSSYAYIFKQSEECRGISNLPDIPRFLSHSTKVAAGNPLTFGMSYEIANTATYRSWCEVAGTFVPEIGKRYETVIVGDYSRCVLNTYEVTGEEKKEIKLLYRKIDRKDVLTPSNAFCDEVIFTATTFQDDNLAVGINSGLVTENADGNAETDGSKNDKNSGFRKLLGSYTGLVEHGRWTFRTGWRKFAIAFEQADDGNLIVRSSPDLELTAELDGDVIKFRTADPSGCYCSFIDGEWTINEDGSELTGYWGKPGGGGGGSFNLTGNKQMPILEITPEKWIGICPILSQ